MSEYFQVFLFYRRKLRTVGDIRKFITSGVSSLIEFTFFQDFTQWKERELFITCEFQAVTLGVINELAINISNIDIVT